MSVFFPCALIFVLGGIEALWSDASYYRWMLFLVVVSLLMINFAGTIFLTD